MSYWFMASLNTRPIMLRPFIANLGLLLGFLVATASATPHFEPIPRGGYPHLQAAGKALMKKRSKDWLHARSTHFMLHGKDKATLQHLEREAEHAWYRLAFRLGLKPDSRPIHIVIVDDAKAWQKLLGTAPDQASKLGAQLDGTVFLLRTGESPQSNTLSTDLAHEITHARLERAFGNKIPLWLEEGLALQLGIDITREFHKNRGQLTEEKLTAPGETSTSTQQIMDFDRYPSDPTTMRAFYTQCRAFTAALLDATGPRGTKSFLAAMIDEQHTWQAALKANSEISEAALKELEKKAFIRTVQPNGR